MFEIIFWLGVLVSFLYSIPEMFFSFVLILHDPHNWWSNLKLGLAWPYVTWKSIK